MDFNLESYQAILHTMIVKFDIFCREHNLRYSLCAGSLLGAVRHGGIIPWDDDIDVMMPRPDYNRLLEIASNSFYDGYKIIHAGNTSHYYLPLAKMTDINTCMIEMRKYMECQIGVNIDIFPIDVIPEDEIQRESVYHKFLNLYAKAIDTAEFAHFKSPFEANGFRINNILHWLKNKFYRIIYDSATIFKYADELISRENWENGTRCRIYSSYQYHDRIFEKNVFEDYTDLNFDGMKIMCISKYEQYLSQLYKNYLELPPIEKRVCHHHHYFIDLNRGYSNKELSEMGIIKY